MPILRGYRYDCHHGGTTLLPYQIDPRQLQQAPAEAAMYLTNDLLQNGQLLCLVI